MFKTYSPLKRGRKIDYTLIALSAILISAGLVFLATTTAHPAETLRDQILKGILPGIILAGICMFLPYQKYKNISVYILFLNIILLGILFLPGLGFTQQGGGAARWLKIGPINFQPSELLKITFVLYLAAWFSNSKMGRAGSLLTGMLPFSIICALIALLLYFQPATSMILILMAAGGAMYFLSNPPLKHVFAIIVAAIMIGILATFLFLSNPNSHRAKRIRTFLNPTADVMNTGYQANQAKTAIGTGGLFGVGLGRDVARVYVPKAENDLIFSAIAQQAGFAGAGFVVVVYAMLIARIFWLARKVRDRFGALTLCGFASIFALQSFVHMAANCGMIPLTGLPLPFISLGGTSMVISLIMMGITVNISKYS